MRNRNIPWLIHETEAFIRISPELKFGIFIINIFNHINVLSPWPFITITTSGANRQDVIVYYDLGFFPSPLLEVYNIGCEPARCRKPFMAWDYYTLCIFFINHFALPNSKSYGFYNNPNIGCEPARWNSLLHRNTGIFLDVYPIFQTKILLRRKRTKYCLNLSIFNYLYTRYMVKQFCGSKRPQVPFMSSKENHYST